MHKEKSENNQLLIVDDDRMLQRRLSQEMKKKGFEPVVADNVKAALDLVDERGPDYAIVELKVADGNGLSVIEAMQESRPDSRAIILTGYGNLASAVTAVKLGAIDYLAKPADPADIHVALTRNPADKPPPPKNPMSADRVRWEHIQRVLELCNRNISETARRLNMHRRSLQRILSKRAPI